MWESGGSFFSLPLLLRRATGVDILPSSRMGSHIRTGVYVPAILMVYSKREDMLEKVRL